MNPAFDITLLTLGALALSVVLLALVVPALFARRLQLSTPADAIHFVRTTDNVRIALHRYEPLSVREGELPIILCHGLGANRFNFDLDEHLSFARYLRGRGYDVFVLELRGSGLSESSRGSNFDDLVERDMPAAIVRVCELTGSSKVNWVGHSLGGMIAYAALGTDMHKRVHAIATIGSPASFAHQPLLRSVAPMFPLVRPFLGHGSAFGARLAAPAFIGIFGRIAAPFFSMLANVRNMEPRVVRRVLWNVISETSPGVLTQIVQWLRSKTGPHLSAQSDPESHWQNLTHPLLLLAGAADWALAPPAAVRHAFYKAPSQDKELIVLSKASGFSADYGHGDLILGKRAREEVFPIVERFLWTHRRDDSAPARSETQITAKQTIRVA
jgi:pimeloyl-ACP methyl ester carboxylesterase